MQLSLTVTVLGSCKESNRESVASRNDTVTLQKTVYFPLSCRVVAVWLFVRQLENGMTIPDRMQACSQRTDRLLVEKEARRSWRGRLRKLRQTGGGKSKART